MEKTTFTIKNDSGIEMLIIHEPECFEFNIPIGDEVIVVVDSGFDSVVLNHSFYENKIVIAILDSKSLY